MSKFKVGDKAQYVGLGGSLFTSGKVYTIREVNDDDTIRVTNNTGQLYWTYADLFVPVDSTGDEPDAERILVGDSAILDSLDEIKTLAAAAIKEKTYSHQVNMLAFALDVLKVVAKNGKTLS